MLINYLYSLWTNILFTYIYSLNFLVHKIFVFFRLGVVTYIEIMILQWTWQYHHIESSTAWSYIQRMIARCFHIGLKEYLNIWATWDVLNSQYCLMNLMLRVFNLVIYQLLIIIIYFFSLFVGFMSWFQASPWFWLFRWQIYEEGCCCFSALWLTPRN